MLSPYIAIDIWAVPGPGFVVVMAVVVAALGALLLRARGAARIDAAIIAGLRNDLREAREPVGIPAPSASLIREESGISGLPIDPYPAEIDLDGFLRSRISSMASHAEVDGIHLSYDGPESPIPIRIDERRFDDAISILVGNALTHTPKGGEVAVLLLLEAVPESPDGEFVPVARISIADTGASLAVGEAERFFVADHGASASMPRMRDAGSQRLVRAKDYVEMHGGTLTARSRSGSGCIFEIQLPLGTGRTVDLTAGGESHPAVASVPALQWIDADPAAEGGDKPSVLVVDDDEDLLDYLEKTLAPVFRPTMARNGREALELLAAAPQDLILSDHGMPVMDGIELLAAVRTDEALRTIPFVLLTGRVSVQDRVEGLRRGADAYIAKPFVVAELVVQMQNLLRLRDTMREQYGTQVFPVEVSAPAMQSADALFVEEARSVVEEHLADPEFDVRVMAERLFVSERTLRRRIRDLTGFSAAKFILELRLQRARYLLEGKVVRTMSEAAAAVGFRDPGYFSKLLQSWRRDLMPDED